MKYDTLDCEGTQESLVEWFSRPPGAAERLPEAIGLHLRTCPDCRDFADDAAAVSDLLRADPTPTPPQRTWEDLGARVGAAVAARVVSPRRRATTRRLIFTLAAAAAVIVMSFADLRRAPVVTTAAGDPYHVVSTGVRELMPQLSTTLVDYHAGMRDDAAFDRVFDPGIAR